MSLRTQFRSLSGSLFHRTALNDDMEAELQAHIQLRADDLERAGASREEAERQARLEFGSYQHYKSECHDAAGSRLLDTLGWDLRYAWRMLRKTPGFTLIAILTLALCIGANSLVFGILDGLVLRPLNVPDAASLYQLEHVKGSGPSHSYPDYLDLRKQNRSFDSMAAYEMAMAGLSGSGTPLQIWLYETSANYFETLQIQPYLGRFYHGADDHGPNSAPYLVLSYSFWQKHFQADRNIIGKVVQLNKHPFTVLGVAPPRFRGSELFFLPDLWVPIINQQQLEASDELTSRGSHSLWVVGHLKQGVTPAQATDDLNAVASNLAKLYPQDDDGLELKLTRPGLIGNTLGGPVRAFVLALMALTGLILLAACANLGSMFAARAADRSREIALRLALGSSHRRIVRQLLTEAMLLSTAGAIAGVLSSVVLLHALSNWNPFPSLPFNLPLAAGPRTYLVSLALALCSGLLFGIVPLQQIRKANPYQTIKNANAGAANTKRLGVKDILLGLQIAICAVLVTSSFVAVRGMMRSLHSPLGFEPKNTLLVHTELTQAGYQSDEASANFQKKMVEAVAHVPGVTAVGYSNRVPLNIGWSSSSVFADNVTDYRRKNALANPSVFYSSPGYFEAASTKLLYGRAFTWNDTKDAPKVAVVNREFARKVFGSEQKALGSIFKIWSGTRIQVAGIVEDGKYTSISEAPSPAVFLSIQQFPTSSTWLIVRSERNPEELTMALDRELHNLDPALPLTIHGWDRELGFSLFAARTASLALGCLGAMGALLAITGIFGLAAYTVSQRLKELGIRIALGAPRSQVLRAALGRIFKILALGSGFGLLSGIAASKLLSYIVYEATPRDPFVLLGVAFTMLALGQLAAWIPAQRALHINPIKLLHED